MTHRRRPGDLDPGYSPSVPGAELLDELAAGTLTLDDPIPLTFTEDDTGPEPVTLTPAGEAVARLESLGNAGALAGVPPAIMAAVWRLAASCARFDGAPPDTGPPGW